MALSAHFKLVAMWALLAALLVASVRADGGAPTTTAAAGNETLPVYKTKGMISVLPVLLLFFIPISVVFCCTICMN